MTSSLINYLFFSAVTPGGIRLGTGALTTRGFEKKDFETIADYCIKSIEIAKRIQEKTGKKLVDFVKAIESDEETQEIAKEINAWAKKFGLPGQ